MAGVIGADPWHDITERLRRMLLAKLDNVPPSPREASEFRPLGESDPDGLIKPFHQLLFPEGLLRPWEFERTFSTTLGSSFEVAARIIGQHRFHESLNAWIVEGPVSPAARSAIDDILRDVKRDGMQAAYSELVNKVVSSYVGSAGSTERVRVDFYVKNEQGDEVFFEMKSPKPNKDQCIGTTEKLLLIHAIRHLGPPRVRTFYGMAFNPYGLHSTEYRHSLARSYLDVSEQTLIGKDFWDFVGGPGTYERVLDVYRAVGLEIQPEVQKRFGL